MSTSYRTEVDVLAEQLLFQRCRVGRGPAREIARRIEGGHGFWDFDQRKLAAQNTESASSTAVVDTESHDGVPYSFPAGGNPGGEAPRVAA
jgi:hypothetical protein